MVPVNIAASTQLLMPRPVLLLLILLTATPPSHAAEPPLAAVTVTGAVEVVLRARDGRCGGNDVPDAPARAFRDAEGQVVLFAPHYDNRALRGPSLDRLALDCRAALPSGGMRLTAPYERG